MSRPEPSRSTGVAWSHVEDWDSLYGHVSGWQYQRNFRGFDDLARPLCFIAVGRR